VNDINWGDAPGWVALVIAAIAFYEARKSRKASERSAAAAEDNAQAAGRSAEAAERTQDLAEQQASRPTVEWRLERRGKQDFVLRNVGPEAATGVWVDESKITAAAQDLPSGEDIPGHGSVEFMMLATDEGPIPNEIWVTWDGATAPVAVPVPHGHPN
jgi:hypothetical protein